MNISRVENSTYRSTDLKGAQWLLEDQRTPPSQKYKIQNKRIIILNTKVCTKSILQKDSGGRYGFWRTSVPDLLKVQTEDHRPCQELW